MPTESEYGDDIQLLDDLTRLKLRLIDKKLKPGTSPRYQRHRRPSTPEYTPTPTPLPERKRERFYKKIDRRNILLQKLWEELGNGGSNSDRRNFPSLPPLSSHNRHRRSDSHEPWVTENLWQKTGNTKKDLMEMMLIQNAQLQQWMMTQTLQRQTADGSARVHNHYYDANTGAPILPPINRADAGSQYPQDFFNGRPPPQVETSPRQITPTKDRSRRKRR